MAAFRELEEVSYGLLSLMRANHAEAQERLLLGRHEQMVERLLEMQDSADRQLRETLAAEEEVAQSLLQLKECTRVGGTQLQQLEAELQQASKDDACLRASLQELREMEEDLQRQERGVDEDSTITIPSAVYVAQLYHQISKIEWDYECEPGTVKGSILWEVGVGWEDAPGEMGPSLPHGLATARRGGTRPPSAVKAEFEASLVSSLE
ncbi:Kinetochore protein Spc24 [Apodemus speciosus]|uniref:Kinetochore protein Spc24 n=1 Tax=Apodemus speciosus TaxID=105296 RepID=A0ABQ0F4F6_APOSI